MSLRHALLAELTAEPMTGYDLVKYFDGTLAFMWSAPHSQIYPELRRMEDLGLVKAETIPRGNRAEKRVYSITDLGVEELRRWADAPLPRQTERSPYRLKAAFFEWASRDAARAQLREHIAYHRGCVADWKQVLEEIDERRVPLLQRRLANHPPADHEAIVAFKRFAFEGAISKAEAEVAWAEKGLALLDELDRARAEPKKRKARRPAKSA